MQIIKLLLAHAFVITINFSGFILLVAAWFLLIGEAKNLNLNNLLALSAAYGIGSIFVGVFFVWPWVRIFILNKNGHPFVVGDLVEILVAPNKNQLAIVCEESGSDPRIKVEIKKVDDSENIYCYDHQIWKV